MTEGRSRAAEGATLPHMLHLERLEKPLRTQMAAASTARVRMRQIVASDLERVAHLLCDGFSRSTVRDWLTVFDRLTQREPPARLPKYGYLMEEEGAPVGVVLVISSTTRSGDASLTRCNLSSWYVRPPYRSYAPLLIARALRHKEAVYINVSPAPHTLPIISVQGFSRYSNGQFFALTRLLRLRSDPRAKVIPVGSAVDFHTDSFERELLLRHAEYGCLSFWCNSENGAYPFVFRFRTIKRFIHCAQLIYCRDREDVVRFARPIGEYLASHGKQIMMIDANGRIPGLAGIYVSGLLPKYYKGPVRPRLGDLAFTESAMFGV